MEFAKRRRLPHQRLGSPRPDKATGLGSPSKAEQAYGNCPQYIHPHEVTQPASGLPIVTDGSLGAAQIRVDRGS